MIKHEEYFTSPLNVRERLGTPAIPTPTAHAPFWIGLPPVPQPVRYERRRRSLLQIVKDEAPGVVAAGGTVLGVVGLIAMYVGGGVS
jgi:hypothetical protein